MVQSCLNPTGYEQYLTDAPKTLEKPFQRSTYKAYVQVHKFNLSYYLKSLCLKQRDIPITQTYQMDYFEREAHFTVDSGLFNFTQQTNVTH